MDTNNYILETYVERALGTYDSRASYHSSYISCRCPVCGDSEANTRKKRGYILKNNPKDRDVWIYMCHNGDCDANEAMTVKNLLKYYFPGLYKEYLREVFSYKSNNDKIKLETNYYKDLEKETKYNETDDVKHFIPILKGSGTTFEKAITYVKSRRIPEEYWKDWYVAVDGRYQGRLIIPFLDNKNSIYYYQGRTLIGQEPKYLNRRAVEDKECFNIYNVDKVKPVIVCEGPIDSIFVENSIATLGIKISQKMGDLLKDMNCYYLFDNDKDGKKYSKKFLENEKYVFNWKKFLKDENIVVPIKDINDFILISGKDKLSFGYLEKYFTNNVYDAVWF